MRSLFALLAALAAICTAVLAVCPEGDLKKYVKLCCALCAVSAIASFLPGSASLSDIGFTEAAVEDLSGEAAQMVIERTLHGIEEAVYSAAEQKYGVTRDDLTVSVTADSSDPQNVRLLSVNCGLKGLKNAVIMKSLENYVADRFGCECSVEFIE